MRERKRLFLNRDDVREALGVAAKDESDSSTVYIEKSKRVKDALHTVLMDSALTEVRTIMLDKVPLLLYFGALDLRDGIEGAMQYMAHITSDVTSAPQVILMQKKPLLPKRREKEREEEKKDRES